VTDYPIGMELVVDPDNPMNVVVNGSVGIYAPEDTAGTSLLPLKDLNGFPLANPLTSNAYGFTPGFLAPLPQVRWKSGEFSNVYNSYIGLRDEAVAAKNAAQDAQAAAASAGADAAEVAQEALAGAVSDAQAAAAAATNAAALVGAPADSAIAAAIAGANTSTRGVLDTTFAGKFSTQQQAADAERLLATIRGFGTQCFVREAAGAYEIGYQIDDVRFVVHTLTTYSGAPGGYANLYQLANAYVRQPISAYDDTSSEVTKAGTWTSTTHAAAYGGTYAYSLTSGNTATFTAPSGTDSLYVIGSPLSNGGAAKVTIVNDLGKNVTASALPAAQDEVTAGNLPSTVLVANGGTLNPTDRVLNYYAATAVYSDANRQIVTGLDRGRAHTVTVTVTGYKHASSSAARVYFSGFAFTGPAAGDRIDRARSWIQDAQVGPLAGLSAYEYAISSKFGGSTLAIGNVHGYDNQTSLVFTVDGVDVTLAAGEVKAGRNIVLLRTSELFHPAATGKVADAIARYEVSAPDGLRLQTKITWAQAGISNYAMQIMWPYTGAWTRGAYAGQTVDMAVTDSNGSEKGHLESYTYAAWSPTGNYAGVCSWDAAAVEGYAHSPVSGTYVQDRSTDMKKMYAPRNFASGGDQERPFVPGEVWTKRCLYRVARVLGANKVLSRL